MTAYAGLIRVLAESPELASAGVAPPSPQETIMLLGGLKELIATTVEDGGDLRGIIDIATDVAVRILAPTQDRRAGPPLTQQAGTAPWHHAARHRAVSAADRPDSRAQARSRSANGPPSSRFPQPSARPR